MLRPTLFRLCRVIKTLSLVAALLILTFGAFDAVAAGPPNGAAPFGTGPGAWPVKGAIYEVSPEYFPNHSLKELTADLPRLEKLGVSVLYLTPIFRCLGNAQYLITDYDALNPRYGAEADLKQLVAAAHRRHIKVLLDLVTSITYEGTDLMTRHPDWILRGKDGQRQRYYPIPLFGWALNCTNPELIRYFTGIARRYVERFDIDGWRVDSPTNNYDPDKVAGDHSRLALLRSVRKAINAVNKDALLIGEVAGPNVLFGKPGDSIEPLFDEVFEAAYDYPFCGFLGGSPQSGYGYVVFDGPPADARLKSTPLNDIVNNRLTSADFVETVKGRRILFNRLRANFIENHDTERVARAFPKQAKALFVLIATLPGVPVVHAGQEIGSTVHPDASGGRNVVVDWMHGDQALQEFYTRVLKVRATSPALLRGDLRDVWKSGDRSIAFLRSAGDDRIVIALNFSPKPVHSVIDIPLAELMRQPDRRYELDDALTGEKSFQSGSQLSHLDLKLDPFGCRLLRIRPAH